MPIKHVNRRAQSYYLHESKTKAGKPKYFFSMKMDGALVDRIPDGFEIYENPEGQVFLRKIAPRFITDAELEIVRNGLEKYAKDQLCIVDFKNKDIIIYDSERGDYYQKIFRFTLVDEISREFLVSRWVFFGSIDNWSYPLASGDLATLTKQYAPHIGQESFFELT